MIRFIRRLSLIVAVLFALSVPAVASEDSSILGVWELTRVDNLRPRDYPPYGMRNFILVFEGDGSFQRWIPEYAQPETFRYQVEGDQFSGWFGFSNDQHSKRKISFPTTNRMDLEFPDGSVASFRRRPGLTDPLEELEAKCVTFTVRRSDYDPEFVASVKKKQDTWDGDGKVPAKLLGKWITILGEQPEERLLIELVMRRDRSASVTQYFVDFEDLGPEVSDGPLSVDGEWLSMAAMSCGAAMQFEVTEQDLRITPDGSHYFEFEKADDED